MDVNVGDLLSESLAAQRRALVGERALDPASVRRFDNGTVYLCAADKDGMMVSFIESNYLGFGSLVTLPEYGVAFADRGADFSLDPSHANRLEPGKRTYHTIIPAFLTRGGEPVGPFGVMGGYMQPQGHLQAAVNMLDFGMNPQAALDAPRFFWEDEKRVYFEPGVPLHIVQGLRRMGHEAEYSLDKGFGRGQAIMRHPLGGYIGATDPRADGAAVGW
jgi:gamma-glutamyltranspeptidase/glutathione hydrolase